MKYMGSKNRIAKDIVPILEKSFYDSNCEIFIDACCGGCNLIDKIDPRIPRFANDYNEYLIEMWKGLQKGNQYPLKIEKELYDVARNIFRGKDKETSFTKDLIGWIGFMSSYNGRFFDGGYSGHNVIVRGGYRDYISENIRNIKKQLNNLREVNFSCKSLYEIRPKKKALIYFDIPYKGTKQYSNSKLFNYDEFYLFCEILKSQGHIIYISEYNMPNQFKCIWEKELKTTINHSSTLNSIERLFNI